MERVEGNGETCRAEERACALRRSCMLCCHTLMLSECHRVEGVSVANGLVSGGASWVSCSRVPSILVLSPLEDSRCLCSCLRATYFCFTAQ